MLERALFFQPLRAFDVSCSHGEDKGNEMAAGATQCFHKPDLTAGLKVNPTEKKSGATLPALDSLRLGRDGDHKGMVCRSSLLSTNKLNSINSPLHSYDANSLVFFRSEPSSTKQIGRHVALSPKA